MIGNQALFQVALGLIPGFFFGGALVERKTDLLTGSGKLLKAFVGMFVLAGVVAAIIAVKGTIDPVTGRWEQRFVAGVIVVGIVAVGMLVAAQWLVADQGWFSTPSSRWLLGAGAGAVLLAAVLASQSILSESITRANARADAEQTLEQLGQFYAIRIAAEREANEARAGLIALAATAPGDLRESATAAVLGRLQRLDLRPALDQLSHPMNATERDEIMRDAIQSIRAVQADFTAKMDVSDSDTNGSHAQLLVLAMNRLAAAETTRLTAVSNETGGRANYAIACIAAGRPSCPSDEQRQEQQAQSRP